MSAREGVVRSVPTPPESLAFLRLALGSLALAALAGLLGGLHYAPGLGPRLESAGLHFTALRPIHTTFATAWIFLAAVAAVHAHLRELGPPSRLDRALTQVHAALWLVAGLLALATLGARITSGREYVDYHPGISLLLLLGWILFAIRFYRATWRGFWERPVFVTMWGVAIPFAALTFLELHAWLLPSVFERPLMDMRIQWKGCGTFVGAFNHMVYGTLAWLGTKLAGSEAPARSRLAYALLGLSLLNSVSNFGHHTYHLPQSAVVNWVSFVVSMTELLVLARVIADIAAAARARADGMPALLVRIAKWWTLGMLATAILMSLPPLNALVHGTHVVTGHAMGTEIGIDTMILLAACAWLLEQAPGARVPAASSAREARAGILVANAAAVGLVAWLTVSGTIVGITRFRGLPAPAALRTGNAAAFAILGGALALSLVAISARLLPWPRRGGAALGTGAPVAEPRATAPHP